MQPKILLTTLLFICLATTSKAQNGAAVDNTGKQQNATVNSEHPKNFIKTNITSIALKNYSFQYERVLSKGVSVAATFRTMPSTSIPFKSVILNAVGDAPDTKELIDKTKLSNFAFTPEVRFYVGKGYGQGFYIAPYYRYVKFTTNQIPVSYTNTLGTKQSINLSGDLTANTGGLMFGVQKKLGKSLCLDLWILGGHYGTGTGNFTGIPSTPLTITEQAAIRQQLENIDIPLTKKTVTVTSTNVAVKLDGPFGGLRSGILIGFRF